MRRIGGVLLALIVAGCGGGDDKPERYSVRYSVSSTDRFTVTYRVGGSTQQTTAVMSWTSPSFNAERGDFLYVSAQSSSAGNFVTPSVTVSISAEGKTIETATSRGAFTIATASTTCCD